jgi:hypothetical protein
MPAQPRYRTDVEARHMAGGQNQMTPVISDDEDDEGPEPLAVPAFPQPPSYVHTKSVDLLAKNLSGGLYDASSGEGPSVRSPSPEQGSDDDMAEVRQRTTGLFAPGARPSEWKS